MSELAQKVAKRDQDRGDGGLSGLEQQALEKMRREAKAAGATLATGGKGGLNPSTVRAVMKRAGWRCQAPGCGSQKNLSVHHLARHLEHPTEKLKKMAKKLPKDGEAGTEEQKKAESGLICLCAASHDEIHDDDRAGKGDKWKGFGFDNGKPE